MQDFNIEYLVSPYKLHISFIRLFTKMVLKIKRQR